MKKQTPEQLFRPNGLTTVEKYPERNRNESIIYPKTYSMQQKPSEAKFLGINTHINKEEIFQVKE
jgi:hypothetical protein